MTRWVMGLDGGGSKTEVWVAALADDGIRSIAGKGKSGPSNPRAVGYAAAQQAIHEAIDQACDEARVALASVEAGCFAIAGAGRAEEQAELGRRVASLGWKGTIRFVHDGWAALAAAFDPPVGIALIAGTGSFAFGRNAEGDEQRVGGWGYLFGDEGGGYDLGRAALRAVAMSTDGRIAPTVLVSMVVTHLEVDEPSQLIERVYHHPEDRRLIADIAPVVLAAAARGDRIANELVDRAAEDLAKHVVALGNRLRLIPNRPSRTLPHAGTNTLTSIDPETLAHPVPIVLAGGVIVHGDVLRERLIAKLLRGNIRAEPCAIVAHPVAGATRLAFGLLSPG